MSKLNEVGLPIVVPCPTEAQLEERRRIKKLKIEFTNEQRQPGVKNPLTIGLFFTM